MSSSYAPRSFTINCRLSDVLAEVGSRVPDAANSLCMEEAISSLDFVQRDSLIGKTDQMRKPIPVLMSDSLEASSFLPHGQDPDTEENFHRGSFNLHQQKLVLYGGCIIDQGSGPAAANIFYSESKQTLLVHVPGADIAGMEATFYDTAFKSEDSWESYVKGMEGDEMLIWRREAAVASRTMGADKMDNMFFDESNYYVLRFGVIPFLSLRHPETAKENMMVREALNRAQRVVSAAGVDSDLRAQLPKMTNVCIASVFEFGHPETAKEFIPEPQEKIHETTDAMLQRPILTSIAWILLYSATDRATDGSGWAISERVWTLPRHIDAHEVVLREVGATEKMYLMGIKRKKDTDMAMSMDTPFSLPTLVHGLGGRRYSLKMLVDGEECSTSEMLAIVTSALFAPDDVKLVGAILWDSVFPSGTPFCGTVVTALTALGKCIPCHQAVVIASRESDGRYSQVRMICHDKSIPRLSIDGFRRAMICPWATLLVVEKKRVYQLSVDEPEEVKCSSAFKHLRKGYIQLRPSVRNVRDLLVEKKEIADVRKEVAALGVTIKEFERKLNYLIEKKAAQESATEEAPLPQLRTSATCTASAPEASSDTVQSLKRSLGLLQGCEKRLKASDTS